MLDLIYGAVEDSTLWKVFLQRFVDDMHCVLGNLNISFFRHRLFSMKALVGFSDEDHEEYANGKWKGQDPWMARLENVPFIPGSMKMSQEFCPDEELEQTEVYRQFLGPRGIHYGGGVLLAATEWQASLMVVLRPKERGPLTEAEQSYWREYVPHLMRALRIIEQTVRLRSERDLLYATLDDTNSGMLLLNSSREILLTNRIAEHLLETGRGLRRRDGVLRAESADDEKRLQAAFLQAGNSKGKFWNERFTVARRGELPLMMMAWRVQQVESPVEQPIMLRVIDAGRPAPLDESALRELFLLTRAEARLACQLASGATLDQAAEAARVSVNTARTHLARVFGKTGTCRQSQLVTLVLLTAAQHRLEAPPVTPTFTGCRGLGLEGGPDSDLIG